MRQQNTPIQLLNPTEIIQENKGPRTSVKELAKLYEKKTIMKEDVIPSASNNSDFNNEKDQKIVNPYNKNNDLMLKANDNKTLQNQNDLKIAFYNEEIDDHIMNNTNNTNNILIPNHKNDHIKGDLNIVNESQHTVHSLVNRYEKKTFHNVNNQQVTKPLSKEHDILYPKTGIENNIDENHGFLIKNDDYDEDEQSEKNDMDENKNVTMDKNPNHIRKSALIKQPEVPKMLLESLELDNTESQGISDSINASSFNSKSQKRYINFGHAFINKNSQIPTLENSKVNRGISKVYWQQNMDAIASSLAQSETDLPENLYSSGKNIPYEPDKTEGLDQKPNRLNKYFPNTNNVFGAKGIDIPLATSVTGYTPDKFKIKNDGLVDESLNSNVQVSTNSEVISNIHRQQPRYRSENNEYESSRYSNNTKSNFAYPNQVSSMNNNQMMDSIPSQLESNPGLSTVNIADNTQQFKTISSTNADLTYSHSGIESIPGIKIGQLNDEDSKIESNQIKDILGSISNDNLVNFNKLELLNNSEDTTRYLNLMKNLSQSTELNDPNQILMYTNKVDFVPYNKYQKPLNDELNYPDIMSHSDNIDYVKYETDIMKERAKRLAESHVVKTGRRAFDLDVISEEDSLRFSISKTFTANNDEALDESYKHHLMHQQSNLYTEISEIRRERSFNEQNQSIPIFVSKNQNSTFMNSNSNPLAFSSKIPSSLIRLKSAPVMEQVDPSYNTNLQTYHDSKRPNRRNIHQQDYGKSKPLRLFRTMDYLDNVVNENLLNSQQITNSITNPEKVDNQSLVVDGQVNTNIEYNNEIRNGHDLLQKDNVILAESRYINNAMLNSEEMKVNNNNNKINMPQIGKDQTMTIQGLKNSNEPGIYNSPMRYSTSVSEFIESKNERGSNKGESGEESTLKTKNPSELISSIKKSQMENHFESSNFTRASIGNEKIWQPDDSNSQISIAEGYSQKIETEVPLANRSSKPKSLIVIEDEKSKLPNNITSKEQSIGLDKSSNIESSSNPKSKVDVYSKLQDDNTIADTMSTRNRSTPEKTLENSSKVYSKPVSEEKMKLMPLSLETNQMVTIEQNQGNFTSIPEDVKEDNHDEKTINHDKNYEVNKDPGCWSKIFDCFGSMFKPNKKISSNSTSRV